MIRRIYDHSILKMRMKYLVIFLVLVTVFFINESFAYHEELEKRKYVPQSGLFTDDGFESNQIIFPLVGKEYRLQIVLDDQSRNQESQVRVGYGFYLLDKIPNHMTPEYNRTFTGFEDTRQVLSLRNSTDIDTEQSDLPMLVNFTVSFDKPGRYQYHYFDHSLGKEKGSGSSGGGYWVVSEYSKAVDANGRCKNPELSSIVKHDFSKLVCIKIDSRHELITRGWAPIPG